MAIKFIVAGIRRALSLIMSFISFFIFFCARIEEPSPRRAFRATFFFLHRSVLGLCREYIHVCVPPCGRRTSQNRYGTIRMMRVVHEDYCF